MAEANKANTSEELSLLEELGIAAPVAGLRAVGLQAAKKVGLPVAAAVGAYETWQAYKNSDGKTTFGVGIHAAGTVGGAWLGGAAGATLGSFFSPVGTVVLGGIGAIGGAVAGDKAVSAAVDWVREAFQLPGKKPAAPEKPAGPLTLAPGADSNEAVLKYAKDTMAQVRSDVGVKATLVGKSPEEQEKQIRAIAAKRLGASGAGKEGSAKLAGSLDQLKESKDALADPALGQVMWTAAATAHKLAEDRSIDPQQIANQNQGDAEKGYAEWKAKQPQESAKSAVGAATPVTQAQLDAIDPEIKKTMGVFPYRGFAGHNDATKNLYLGLAKTFSGANKEKLAAFNAALGPHGEELKQMILSGEKVDWATIKKLSPGIEDKLNAVGKDQSVEDFAKIIGKANKDAIEGVKKIDAAAKPAKRSDAERNVKPHAESAPAPSPESKAPAAASADTHALPAPSYAGNYRQNLTPAVPSYAAPATAAPVAAQAAYAGYGNSYDSMKQPTPEPAYAQNSPFNDKRYMPGRGGPSLTGGNG